MNTNQIQTAITKQLLKNWTWKRVPWQTAMPIVGNVVRKVAESAVHAAVFAYVSKKVTNLMTKREEANKEKVRIDDTTVSPTETSSTERI